MTQELYNNIINLIPSNSAKEKLAECGYIVPDVDLFSIIDRYAHSFDEQIQLFDKLCAETNLQDLKDAIEFYKKLLFKSKSEFEENNGAFVYMINVNAIDSAENYICKEYEDILKFIDLYDKDTKEVYEDEEIPPYKYVVSKKKIFDPHADNTFEYYAESRLEFLPGKKLYRVEVLSSIEYEPYEDLFYNEIQLPVFAKHMDILEYKNNYDGKIYRLCNFDTDNCDKIVEVYYAIDLGEAEDYSDPEIQFRMHDHPYLTECERISEDKLTWVERENYKKLCESLRKSEE